MLQRPNPGRRPAKPASWRTVFYASSLSFQIPRSSALGSYNRLLDRAENRPPSRRHRLHANRVAELHEADGGLAAGDDLDCALFGNAARADFGVVSVRDRART